LFSCGESSDSNNNNDGPNETTTEY